MDVLYNYEFVIDKLTGELEECKTSTNEKIKAIAGPVAENLIKFAENKDFGLKIQTSEKTLLDCCTEVVKGVKSHISDIEVYKKAVQFYFPEADIKFSMDIQLTEDADVISNKKISIDLDDLF